MSRYSSNVLLCLAVFGGSELKDTCSVRKQNVQMIPNNRKRRYGRLSRNALAAMLLLPVVPVTGVWNIYVRRCLYSIPLWSTCVFGLVFFTFKKAGAKIPRKRPWFWWKMQTFNVVFLKTIKTLPLPLDGRLYSSTVVWGWCRHAFRRRWCRRCWRLIVSFCRPADFHGIVLVLAAAAAAAVVHAAVGTEAKFV